MNGKLYFEFSRSLHGRAHPELFQAGVTSLKIEAKGKGRLLYGCGYQRLPCGFGRCARGEALPCWAGDEVDKSQPSCLSYRVLYGG